MLPLAPPPRGEHLPTKRRRGRVCSCILSILTLVACSHDLYTHEAVREAAEKHYARLMEGDYRGFVEDYACAEEWPEGYRSQLVDATAQFMAGNPMQHLVSVTATADSLREDSTACVILKLGFSDSTEEQIEQTLTLTKEGWKIR